MIPQECQNHNNVFFLKTLFLLIIKVNIINLTSDYVLPEYRVQIGVNFSKFGFSRFCEEQANVSEVLNQFFNYTKGGQMKKYSRRFFIRLYVFSFLNKCKLKKMEMFNNIASQHHNGRIARRLNSKFCHRLLKLFVPQPLRICF